MDRSRHVPYPQIVEKLNHVVKDIVLRCGQGGEGILVFLPGISEITELHDTLMPLEQVRKGK
jgi:HrpA-like RNA helicase